jgi:hydroxymethylglutaryl-CoA lyase
MYRETFVPATNRETGDGLGIDHKVAHGEWSAETRWKTSIVAIRQKRHSGYVDSGVLPDQVDGHLPPACIDQEDIGDILPHRKTSNVTVMNESVQIFEVGPRDGLQNEKAKIPTERKIELVDRLSDAGFSKIEVTSFVSPKWVPQMKDAPRVLAGIRRAPGVVYAALTPNRMGYQFARRAGAGEVAIFAAASETFSQRNINCSITESIERFVPVMEMAAADGVPVRGYVSCVAGCPYEGEVSPRKVAEVTAKLLEIGCYEVSLGDTIGTGTPQTISAMLDAALSEAPADKLAGHYHDTGGRALENIGVSLEKGLRTFDSAVGGLGGCPYAPGARGNVATGAVVEMLHGRGLDTGIDQQKLPEIEQFAAALVAKPDEGVKPH